MTGAQRLALLGPHRLDADGVEALARALPPILAAGDVAALVLRLAPADERGLINRVKRVASVSQEAGAALVVACPGFAGDLATLSARGGADGVHVDRPRDLRDLRGRLRDGRILGAGGLETKHAAMDAGEAAVDYVMFGGLYPDGAAPDPETVRARAAWWAEIFETPCVAVAGAEADVAALAATGAEFVGLESGIWLDRPDAVARAHRALSGASA